MLLFDWICCDRDGERKREIYPIERANDVNLVFHRLILALELIALFDDLFHLLDEVLFALTKITLKFDDRVVERLKGKERLFVLGSCPTLRRISVLVCHSVLRGR